MEKLLEKYIESFVKEADLISKVIISGPKTRAVPKQLELFPATSNITPKTTSTQAALMTKILPI
jgi:uncharacterized protein